MRRFVDLSTSIESGLPVDPPAQIPSIEYITHKGSAPLFAGIFGCQPAELPEENGWAVEFLTIGTHAGTHLDAPYHFYPTMDGGQPAWTIDEVPLEWCMGDGVVLDCTDLPDGHKLTVDDLRQRLDRLSYTLKPGDILLLRSGAASRWGSEAYLMAGCGVSGEATRWIIDQGVRVMGTDGWSWDIPLPLQAEEYRKSQDASLLWEAHRVGRERAYCHMEKLAHLDQIPAVGSTICCFPVKIHRASAGWTRVVAIIEDERQSDSR